MQTAAASAGAPLTASATRPALARLDLPSTLLVVTVLELVLERWGVRLFFPSLLARLRAPARALEWAGSFVFHLLAILGFCTAAYLVAAAVLRRDAFARPLRALLLAVATYVLPLSAAALFVPGSESVLLHAYSGLVLLVSLLFVAVLLTPGEARAKAGVLCMALPLWFSYYAAFAFRFPWAAPGGDLTGLPTHALRLGQSAVVAAAVVSLLCFMPVERLRRLGGFGPLLLASTITVGVAVLSARRFDLALRAASLGFGIDLPFALGLRAIYLAGLFSLSLTVLSLIATGGARRGQGVGLALWAFAGYQPHDPVHLVVAGAGFIGLALATALERAPAPALEEVVPVAPPPDPAAWRAYVAALKRALSPAGAVPAEAIVVEGEEGEITRVRGQRRGLPVTLRVLRRQGLIRDVDVTIGATAPGAPALSLHPRGGLGARRLGPAADGVTMPTGDPAFDRRFRLRGSGAAIDLVDAGLRDRLGLLEGWIGVWPRVSVRYHAVPARDPSDAMTPLAAIAAGDPGAAGRTLEALDVLVDVARRAER